MAKKPTYESIIKLKERCIEIYDGKLWKAWEEDEEFYELEFGHRLYIADQFVQDKVVLPTGRDKLDSIIDHTDVLNARIYVNKKGTSETSDKSAEMLRKFAHGLIHRTNVESDIAPARVSSKHFWLYGLTVLKTIWDADNWIGRPPQDGKSDDEYAKELDAWRAEHHLSLPIIIKAINPANVMPDPYYGGRLFVIERHQRLLLDLRKMHPKWNMPKDKLDHEEVEYVEYWDKDFRCVLIDDEPAFGEKRAVVAHKYGFIPYTFIETGLGNLAKDAKPEKRYVGLLRYIKDILVSESTNYTMCDILMKRETMKGGYITGTDAKSVGKQVSQAYGEYTVVGNKDVEFHDWKINLAPDGARQHLALSHDYISQHVATRSLMGVGESGVRSGADRRLVLAEGQSKLNYAKEAFANGWSQVLTKCARLVKDVIPGDFEIWAKTPYDEFDMVIKKNLFKEPFNFYVEFAPISEQDEYARHDDLIRRYQGGLISQDYAISKQSGLDKNKEKKEMTKEMIRQTPAYTQMLGQHFSTAVHMALEEAGIPMMPPEAQQAQQEGQQGQQGQARGNVPPIPQETQYGAARDNAFANQTQRRPVSPTQGQGGGGNRG